MSVKSKWDRNKGVEFTDLPSLLGGPFTTGKLLARVSESGQFVTDGLVR